MTIKETIMTIIGTALAGAVLVAVFVFISN